MAIFHLHVKNISRSSRKQPDAAPRSALAAAAYRAGETLWNAAEEKLTKYGGRRDVLFNTIVTPHGAPAWMRDRHRLWNAVEAVEKRRDARLAKEIEFALPRELSLSRWVAITREMAEAYASQGLVVDMAIHEDGLGRNPHAHLMLTTRAVTADGFGGKLRWTDKPGFVDEARALWQKTANVSLGAAGVAPIDARSHQARGDMREPGRHRGPDTIERQTNRELAAMQRADLELRTYLNTLEDQRAKLTLPIPVAEREALRTTMMDNLQALQDRMSDALVAAGLMQRDTATQFWKLQRELLTHEDYAAQRRELLGIEAYADEPPHQPPTRAQLRELADYERAERDRKLDALFDFNAAREAAAESPPSTPPSPPNLEDHAPVPDPDGDPISPQQLEAAEARLLADYHSEEDRYRAAHGSTQRERVAAERVIDRINTTPVSERAANAYRIATPDDVRQSVRDVMRARSDQMRMERVPPNQPREQVDPHEHERQRLPEDDLEQR